MSPFARGLLGGVAEGITDTASLLFQDAIAAKKEKRLAAIADRNYARDRADTLSDIDSQREFQKGLVTEERSHQDTVREEDFNQRKQLADLSLNQQKSLMDYALQTPQSALGKLLNDRAKYEPGYEQYGIYTQQIQSSQIIKNTNPYTGAISLAIPEFDARGNLIGAKEVGSFGGFDNDGDGTTLSQIGNVPPTDTSITKPNGNPAINSLSADEVQEAITKLEAALSSGDLRGGSEPQIKMRLRELEERLQTLNAQSSNAQSSSGLGLNPRNPSNTGLLAGL